MSEQTLLVKICGLTRLVDADLCLEAGADYLGVIFADSPRAAPGGLARTLNRRGDPVVGVFRHRDDEFILDIVEREELTTVQLHDPASTELRDELTRRGVQMWRAVPAERWREEDLLGASVLLLDGPHPGSGRSADWTAFERPESGTPFLIAGGLRADNVAAMVEHIQPAGVDVASGVEVAPGVKSPELVRQFVRNARVSGREGSR